MPTRPPLHGSRGRARPCGSGVVGMAGAGLLRWAENECFGTMKLDVRLWCDRRDFGVDF